MLDVTTINDKANVVDRERGLSDVGAEDDLARILIHPLEDHALILTALITVQRVQQHIGNITASLQNLLQSLKALLACHFTILGTSQEDQDVSWSLMEMHT